ncbi:MAG: DUF3301 domain-containing protein [Gammaproteobacteria bacterium]|nr:DUF3301 domain-containing protein [Gammaproteobacteria bacterium]
MQFSELLILFIFAGVIWYWLDGVRTKELASHAGRDACKQANVDFLDDTVALMRVRIKRDKEGRILINRFYQFEFSSDGSCRYEGKVEMLGKRLMNLFLDVHRFPPEVF